MDEFCSECGHDIDLHVLSVRGKIKCHYIAHGTSSRGVIGIPYQVQCKCLNYKLPPKEKTLGYDDD